jgi:hypothetical protein
MAHTRTNADSMHRMIDFTHTDAVLHTQDLAVNAFKSADTVPSSRPPGEKKGALSACIKVMVSLCAEHGMAVFCALSHTDGEHSLP